MTRRNFLEVTGKTAAVAAFFSLPVITSVNAEETPDFSAYPFTLGVASGDPLSDSVVLWTRLAPNPLAEDGNGGMFLLNGKWQKTKRLRRFFVEEKKLQGLN